MKVAIDGFLQPTFGAMVVFVPTAMVIDPITSRVPVRDQAFMKCERKRGRVGMVSVNLG